MGLKKGSVTEAEGIFGLCVLETAIDTSVG